MFIFDTVFSVFDYSFRPKVTNVTADHMNSVLGSVLKLINNNIDATEAPWMKRIAGKIEFLQKKISFINLIFYSLYTSNNS
jgi:hypothetical protein